MTAAARSVSFGKVTKSAWTHLAFVKSENDDDVEYEIKKNADGRIGCGCLAYRFAKGNNKTCKHIEGFFDRGDVVPTRDSETTTRIRITYKGKTDTLVVRRAISFEGDL